MSANPWKTSIEAEGSSVSTRGDKNTPKQGGKGRIQPQLVEADLTEATRGLTIGETLQAHEDSTPELTLTTGGNDNVPRWDERRKQKKIKGQIGKAGKKVNLCTNHMKLLKHQKFISVFHFAFTDAEGQASSQKVDITGNIDISNNPLAYDGSKILVQYGPIEEGKNNAHDDNYVIENLKELLNANNSRLKLDTREDLILDYTAENLKPVYLQYLDIILTKNLPSATYKPLPQQSSRGQAGRGRGNGVRGGRGGRGRGSGVRGGRGGRGRGRGGRGGRGRGLCGRGGGRGGQGRPDYDAQTLDIRCRYKTATKYGETGPQVVLDVQGSIVYKEMMLLEHLKKRGININGKPDGLRDKIKKEIDGMKLLPTHRNEARPVTVKDISKKPINQLRFKNKDGEMETVYNFFKTTYPQVKLNPKSLAIRSSTRNDIYFPMEVLRVVKEQTFKREIPKAAISAVHFKPQQRSKLIGSATEELKKNIQRTSDGNFVLAEDLLKVTGREIGSIITEKRKKFYIAKDINKWVVIVADEKAESKDIATAIESFISAGQRYGMKISKPMSNPISIESGGDLEPSLKTYLDQGLKFVLLIKSEQDKTLYNDAKRYYWIKTAIPIQVCLSKHFKNAQERRLNSYMGNLLLKVNLKLGGSNFKFSEGVKGLPSKKTLILGLDVSHGMLNVTGAEKLPNLATIALIAFDPDTNKLSSSFNKQHGRNDVLKPSTMTQLLNDIDVDFNKYDSFIMYRDGVGESMFHSVEQNEYVALRNVVGAKKKITFLVFNKRHRTRFFKIENGRIDNPNAGTVVDTVVTNKHDYDFFLQAHKCGIGSAKLPHYIVLHDDHKFNADNLQSVTNQLSCLYQRSFGPVSQTCASYYAHILADKCRFLLDDEGNFPKLHQRLLSTSQMYFL